MTRPDPLLDDSPECEDPDYFREVSRFFLALRGTGLFLAPTDAALVLEWCEQGIPLKTVLRGLHVGAEKLYARKQPLRTLRRLKRYVVKEGREATRGLFRTPHGGTKGVDPQAASLYDKAGKVIAEHREVLELMRSEAAETPDRALFPVLERTLTGLERLAVPEAWGEGGPVVALLELGRQFYAGLQTALPPADQQALRLEAEASLRGFTETMSEESRAETLREITVGILRERCHLFEPARLLSLWDEQ